MAEETKPILAKDIVDDPQIILGFLNEYIMLKDSSIMATYTNLIESMNILGEYGWETVSMSINASNTMFALVRNTNYKHKNG